MFNRDRGIGYYWGRSVTSDPSVKVRGIPIQGIGETRRYRSRYFIPSTTVDGASRHHSSVVPVRDLKNESSYGRCKLVTNDNNIPGPFSVYRSVQHFTYESL